MVIVQFHGRLVRQYRACVIDYETYIAVLCVQGIPILSPWFFMPSTYSTLQFENFFVYLSPLKSQFLNLLIILVQVSSNSARLIAKKNYVISCLDYSCMWDKCTVHCIARRNEQSR